MKLVDEGGLDYEMAEKFLGFVIRRLIATLM